ncbi:hypothetical protein BGW39_009494 [Mortierella sp. 14UC]|nr:hypothetical protein BGW39_009494 [Mortierella sp. 14UC]
MTHVVPTLKKDSTRNLCDQFTNIFYVDDLPSSIDIALATSASQKSLQQDTTASSLDLASFASSVSYPSPAASSEESDDSLLIDSLSPPSSPWFPSLSTAGSSSFTDSKASKATREDVDFFRNPFYRSLHQQDGADNSGVHPQSLFVQRRKVSLPQAVKSSRDRSNSGQVSQTAAPSDLFNVSLDQILSAGPLNLSLETQQMLLSAVEEAFPSSQEELGQQLHYGSTPSQEECDMMEDTLTTGSLSAPEDTEDEDVESIGYGQQQRHQHGAECSHESEVDDPSDSDYRESTPVQQKRARSSDATKKKKTPRGTSSTTTTTTTGKAPRVRKGTYKRSLKVYPPRRPKANIISEVKLESDNGDVTIETELSKGYGVKLPGGLKLPLDKDGYLCEFCPKERFGRVHDLKRHQISKHNERTWPCDFCHRPFVRRDALLRHYAVKTARKDGVHPTAEDVDRLSEARARARLI